MLHPAPIASATDERQEAFAILCSVEATPRRHYGRHLLWCVALPLLTAVALPLSGCLPYPHTSEEFPAVQGHIVDATTLKPVPGARIAFEDHPDTFTTSDASGSFHFPRVTHFYLGVTIGMCSGEWPENDDDWSPVFDVVHPEYEPFHGYVQEDLADRNDSKWTLQAIRLMPKPH